MTENPMQTLLSQVVQLKRKPNVVGIVRGVSTRDDGQFLCTIQITDPKKSETVTKGDLVVELATSLTIV